MSHIKILPDILCNKIAAGEVVARPASVVKELCENALDAGSTRISVTVENGGAGLIRIADNGLGMTADDALLAIERHATSKIYTDDDLFNITTMGFRGEALPSIASVSRFTLITRAWEGQTGTRIYIEGGTIKKVTEVGAADGTMIEVRDLFFNTPARRKFLKSKQTETAHITDAVSAMALCRHDVTFSLTTNRSPAKIWSATSDPLIRAADIVTVPTKEHLVAVDHKDTDIHIFGWIAVSDIDRSTARGMYAFANRRRVLDRKINHAITEGFAGRLMKGRFPVAAIFIDVPPNRLDVNVHPAKYEVRFSDERHVLKTIRAAVTTAVAAGEKQRMANALSQKPAPTYRYDTPPAVPPAVPANMSDDSDDVVIDSFFSGGADEFREGVKLFRHSDSTPPKKKNAATTTSRPLDSSTPNGFDHPRTDKKMPPDSITTLPARPATPPKTTAPAPAAPQKMPPPPSVSGPTPSKPLFKTPGWFSKMHIIGQFLNTYILCELDENLFLIDQHAAHERILFEKLKKQARDQKFPSQTLMIPEIVEMGHAEFSVISEILPELAAAGLTAEPFGGNSIAVKAVPSFLVKQPVTSLMTEIAETILDKGDFRHTEKALEPLLITLACHGAIKARQQLSDAEIHQLLSDLDACTNPGTCPHGRPTWISRQRTKIEKLFKR